MAVDCTVLERAVSASVAPEHASGLAEGLRWLAHHSGLPVILVAAIAIALSWRILKKLSRLLIEIAIALAILLIATKLGWISW
jgi:hypothetical protein